MNILFLSRWFPYPPSNGSKLRIYNLLRGLGQHHNVTLISFIDQPDRQPAVEALHAYCREVHTIPWKPFTRQSRRAQVGFLSSNPRSVIDTFSPAMRHQIEKALATQSYDVVVASQFDMAVYSPYFRGLPALFEEVELGVLYERFACAPTLLQRIRAGLTWLKHRRYLTSLFRYFRVCTVVSNRERQLLSTLTPDPQFVAVIPNGVDLTGYQTIPRRPQPDTLVFTGSFGYLPNYEAMVWFLSEVYPRIQAQMPQVRLFITGDHENRPLPPASNVTLTGFVDDVRPLIAGAGVSIAPLHTGGGTRLKILEAMALGTPVVATAKGAEGLEVQTGTHLLIADTPEAFAQATLRLLQERELRRQLVTQAHHLISTRYDWQVLLPHFLGLVENIAGS